MFQYLSIGLFGILLQVVPACQDKNLQKPAAGEELVLTSEQQEKVKSDNAFTWALFTEAVQEGSEQDNTMLSPLSVSMALGMTANGAVGATQEAMFKTLRYDGYSQPFINEYYQKLIQALPGLDAEVELNMANSIWYKQGFNVLPAFVKTNESYYQATVKALNFNDPAATQVINTWVNKKTHEKIPTIVDRIDPDMRMYLVNAIYFKGAWETPFKKEQTRSMDFHATNGVVQTPFMNREGRINIQQTDAFDAVELPYGDKTYSMVAVLPHEGKTPKDLLEDFQNSEADRWAADRFQSRYVRLALPKFTFEYEITLNDALERLGMGLALSDQADFSGISKESDLTISEVKHKTFVEVNEEGTEAAAVTSVGVSVTSMPQYIPVSFDRPFLFFIRENTSGLILFVGQINKPVLSK